MALLTRLDRMLSSMGAVQFGALILAVGLLPWLALTIGPGSTQGGSETALAASPPKPVQIARADDPSTRRKTRDRVVQSESEIVPPGCDITLSGYRSLETGMSYRQVYRALGLCEGQEISRSQIGSAEVVVYGWKQDGAITATFQNDRMIAKAQFRLREREHTVTSRVVGIETADGQVGRWQCPDGSTIYSVVQTCADGVLLD